MSDHEAILVRLDAIHELAEKIEERLTAQNGRVRTCEVAIGALQWAVFAGGGAGFSAVIWLLLKHMAV